MDVGKHGKESTIYDLETSKITMVKLELIKISKYLGALLAGFFLGKLVSTKIFVILLLLYITKTVLYKFFNK